VRVFLRVFSFFFPLLALISRKDYLNLIEQIVGRELPFLGKMGGKDKKIDSEKEWKRTFDSISDFVSVHDEDYRFLKVNNALDNKIMEYIGLWK
jgi:PAS domain-containing protein